MSARLEPLGWGPRDAARGVGVSGQESIGDQASRPGLSGTWLPSRRSAACVTAHRPPVLLLLHITPALPGSLETQASWCCRSCGSGLSLRRSRASCGAQTCVLVEQAGTGKVLPPAPGCESHVWLPVF